MLDNETFSQLREQLMEQRKSLREKREHIRESLENLNNPEIEPEENAGKSSRYRSLEIQDEQLLNEINLIDNALAKFDKGSYGQCEICHQPISPKRLHAVPYARDCIRCAQTREDFTTEDIEEDSVKLNTEELSDEEMQDAIEDALNEEELDQTDLEEVKIHCENGVVYLDGVIPGESARTDLYYITKDILGFEVVDNLRVERTFWEKPERDQPNPPEKTNADIMAEGEDHVVDAQESIETGEPMVPPDKLNPEEP